jgi:predicted ATPase
VWPGGEWFCDLTEARDLNGIVSAVAGSLAVPVDSGDPVTRLVHAIASRGRALLILDNFEQVSDHASETVGRWLDRAPDARFLVTSRERLHVRGEEVLALDPLEPETGAELFIDRARRQSPGFEPEPSAVDLVREVVRLADGMPLAIELAAARIRVMAVSEIVERMRERFQLLRGAGEGRHASLKAVIDGSWEGLEAWEKAAWTQCAVFEGGFTLADAEGVLDLAAWDRAPWVVDVVQSLVDKSLLRARVPEQRPGGGLPVARFGMYATLQEYARQKLREAGAIPGGGSGAAAERRAEERHGNWFARYGEEVSATTRWPGGAIQSRAPDLENLTAACRRALARGDQSVAVATFRAASAVLLLRGPMGVALDLGQEVMARLAPDSQGMADTLMSVAQSEWYAGRMKQARLHFDQALAIVRRRGDRSRECVILDSIGSLHRTQGDLEAARASHDEALAIARAVADRGTEGVVLNNLGIVYREQGRLEEARSCYEAALAIHRETGNRHSEGIGLSNLGNLLRSLGRLEEARARHEAALKIHREIGNRRSEGHVLGSLGNLHFDLGQMDEARAKFEAALAIHREFGDRRFEGVVVGYLGHWSAKLGRLEEAAARYQAALAIAREVGARRFEGNVLGELGTVERQRGRLEEARASLARGEAILRQLDARIDLGKLLLARAELEHDCGERAAMRRTLDEAESLAVEMGAGPSSELGRVLDRLRQTLGGGDSDHS